MNSSKLIIINYHQIIHQISHQIKHQIITNNQIMSFKVNYKLHINRQNEKNNHSLIDLLFNLKLMNN